MKSRGLLYLLTIAFAANVSFSWANETDLANKPRVIVTSDGEIDDECSIVRFLLYANDWDIEGLITSSSQYHWHGHKWSGDDWIQPYLKAYGEVRPNLLQHAKGYPTEEYLQSVTFLGNVKAEGDMQEATAGSQHIVKVLLDKTDDRPIWLQAWGGTNTIARALKTIEQEHPNEMAYVANKIRFYFIWEQDETYQNYILPHWGKYKIMTIISDQFWALAYQWKQILPEEYQTPFKADWMNEHILHNHGPLAGLYKAHVKGSYGLKGDYDFTPGDFRSEGDSPAFIHTINTGLRNLESPDWGGWGGRYINVRDNTWLDPVPVAGYEYPEGRWYTRSAWGRMSMREGTKTTKAQRTEYFKPMWRWTKALQNDFAARADWSVKSFAEANHPPTVTLSHAQDLVAKSGDVITVNAEASTDQDNDKLHFKWWHYQEAGSYPSEVKIQQGNTGKASMVIPKDAQKGMTIHLIAEVTDNGTPALTRYKRVIVKVQ